MPRCLNCNNKFDKKYSWQMGKFRFCILTDDCYDALTIKRKEVQEIERKKQWNKEKKEIKQSLKSWMDYYQEALKEFNTFIRLRDKDQPCISCDASAGTYTLTSGHYFPQGQNKSVALDEDNAHSQCWFNCNKNKSGNLTAYLPRLIAKIGKKRFNALERKKNITKKYSIPELIEIKLYYKQKIKEIKTN